MNKWPELGSCPDALSVWFWVTWRNSLASSVHL